MAGVEEVLGLGFGDGSGLYRAAGRGCGGRREGSEPLAFGGWESDLNKWWSMIEDSRPRAVLVG